MDRLARSIADLQDVVRELRSKGASLRCTEQPVDTSSAAGKAFLDMLGVFAEFETALRRERQMEGIARAKAAGKYKGRRPRGGPGAGARVAGPGGAAQRDRAAARGGRTTVWRALRGAGDAKAAEQPC